MKVGVAREIENFFAQYPLRHFKRGQILIYQGDPPTGIFHLIEGDVSQYDITKHGDEIVVNVFKPPAFFPMNWAINGTPNEYFFEAITDVSLRQAPASDTIDFLKANHDVLYDLLSRVYMGTDGLLRRMALLMGGSARTRTIFELIVACRRFGKKGPSGYALELSETELAARAGLSRETISRELHKLKSKGLVSITHKSIVVRNLSSIEEELSNSQ